MNFGIIITTYNGDFFLTKALLASIKKFMPSMPICIIQDGNFSMEKEKATYNITHVIKKDNVQDKFLRNNCFGSRCTNMIAFWESPFEKFLYLDSDLVLWGDIIQKIDLTAFDFAFNEPHEDYNEFIYKSQYFDYDRLFEHVEKFPWQDCHFFNAGVFICKRGLFDIEEFKVLFSLWKNDRSLMPAEPQGMINYMVFNNKYKGEIMVLETHLQTVVPVKSIQELENTFQIINGEPFVKENTVIHWAGLKPFITNKGKIFMSPEIYFRKEHLKNSKSLWRFLPIFYFYHEEFKSVLNRYHNGSIILYLKRKIQTII